MDLIDKQTEKAEEKNAKDEAQTAIQETGTQLTDEELEKVDGGADFWRFHDEGKRKPK